MKVGVIKLGSRISFNANDTSGGNGEARSIIKMLKEGGADVSIITKILKKDNLLPQYNWLHIMGDSGIGIDQSDLDAHDVLVVLNGNVNFFGGAEDPEQLMNYKIINNFKGQVYYIYCDPSLTLKQVWQSVEKKPWGNEYSKEDLFISRTDIIYLSQPHDIEKVAAKLSKNEIIPSKFVHFPFEQFPCLNEQLPVNETPEVDLSYGGTMRGGKRTKKMIKFYFDHPEEISVEMFGKIKAEDFTDALSKWGHDLRHPQFSGAIKYDEMLPKMNKAMCHIVIGDPYYEEINDMAQRAYESIWSNVVTFIDTDLDQLRRVYGRDKELADFLYVADKKEVAEKILLLKNDPELRKQILQDQLNAINFNSKEYCERFVNLLREHNGYSKSV